MPATRAALWSLVRKALLLRLALAVLLHYTTDDYTFAPDQETYHLLASRIASYWTGDFFVSPGHVLRQGEPRGYYYIVAALYFLLGDWALIPKLLNAAIGAWIVWLVFDLALSLTSARAIALRAARYVAYFPSLILWSVLNIRDTWVVLLVVLICRQALKLQQAPTIRTLLLLGSCVLAVTQFRSYILFAVSLPILVSFFVRERAHMLRNSVLGMLIAGVIIYADAAAGRERRMRVIDWEDLSNSRRWSSTAAHSGFAQDADISSPGKAVAFLPVGLTYFMLAPFPWTVANFRQGFTIPEMLFFYSILPSIVGGVWWLLRNRLGDSLMIILLTGGITLGYAVGQGNVGTIYRHRAQVLPFFLVFAAVGIEVKRRGRAPMPVVVAPERQPARITS